MSPVAELVLAVGGGYVAIWLWRARYRPMAPCRWCGGQGKKGDRERWRNLDCKHCGNTGERMTWGARLVHGRRWGK